jgi:hypothetical protein
MTKKDVNHVVIGGAVGLGLFGVFWFFLRPKLAIKELAPTQVKWEQP